MQLDNYDEETQQELLSLYYDRFAGRLDTYALKVAFGDIVAYMPSTYTAKEPGKEHVEEKVNKLVRAIGTPEFGPEAIRAHLTGVQHLGVYAIDKDSNVRWFALDFDRKHEDDPDPWEAAVAQATTFAMEGGLSVAIERSQGGKGFHVWGFLDGEVNAGHLRHALFPMIEDVDSFDRMFPNQDGVSETRPLGNLIALPFFGPKAALGNSVFVKRGPDGQPVAIEDQWAFLRNLPLNPVSKITELFEQAGKYQPQSEASPRQTDVESLGDSYKLTHPKFGCEWVRWCFENPSDVDEPQWYALACQFAQLANGRALFHHWSQQDTRRYSKRHTDRKFDQALSKNMPHTCEAIRGLGGNCECDRRFPGKVPHPYDLCKIPFKQLVESVGLDDESSSHVTGADDGFDAVMKWAREVEENPGMGQGRKYGIRSIDFCTGMRDSDLIIIAARPGMGKCITSDTLVFDPTTGLRHRIEDLYRAQQATVSSMTQDMRLTAARVSDFVDDGMKPVFKVTTRLGREIKTTASHPYLTPSGWTPLVDLAVGARIGVPRTLDAFGSAALPDDEVILLALLIADGSVVTENVTYTKNDAALQEEFATALASTFAGYSVSDASYGGRATTVRVISGRNRTPFLSWLAHHGLRGKKGPQKAVPDAVFGLPREQMALFLNRLFSGDGSVEKSGVVSYCSASKQLAQDVQHLLLRFGIISRLRERTVKYQLGTKQAFEVVITGHQDVITFVREIGVYGAKEAAAAEILALRESKAENTNYDTIPPEVWETVAREKGDLSWAALAVRAGIADGTKSGKQQGTNLHVGKRSISRGRMAAFATALDSPTLRAWAESDVYWDEIVAIEPLGLQQVYDLTVPGTHNFVANDILVHNTAFAGSVMNSGALDGDPSYFFSIEMASIQFWKRQLSTLAKISQTRMTTGQLSKDEWEAIKEAHAYTRDRAKYPIYVDDMSRSTDRMFEVAARLVHQHGKGVIWVDYLQLVQRLPRETMFDAVTRVTHDLKLMAKALDCPVVALTQLNRTADDATSDTQTSDAWLRGSGDIEQAADVIAFLLGEKGPGVKERIFALHKERHRESGMKITLEFNQSVMSYADAGTWQVGPPVAAAPASGSVPSVGAGAGGEYDPLDGIDESHLHGL